MPNWIPVSPSQHAGKHYLPRQGFSFAASRQVIPILLSELSRLLQHYPLAFIQQERTYQPVAITGLGGMANQYLNHEGKWLAPYVPAFLCSHPYRLLTTENRQKVLCIQEDHLVEGTRGKPLFDQEGNLTKPVQDILEFLYACEKNRRVTQGACAALKKAGMIEKWPFQIKQAEDREPLKLEGLYKISEKVLNDLEAPIFAGLRSNGALALAYAQLFSMNQISQLVERAKYQSSQKKPDIGQLFAEDDMVNFDNV